MNNFHNDDNRNSAPSSKMSKKELNKSFDELSSLAKEMNNESDKGSRKSDKGYSSSDAPVRRPMRNLAEDRESLRHSSSSLRKPKTQAEKDAEYYRTMSMTQGYDAMDEGVEYQLHDDRIRESNSWFIDESKEANPYEKRDDGDYLRRMDKMFLNDQKDYYQNVSLSYRFPFAFMFAQICLVFVGIPVLLFILGMMFLL